MVNVSVLGYCLQTPTEIVIIHRRTVRLGKGDKQKTGTKNGMYGGGEMGHKRGREVKNRTKKIFVGGFSPCGAKLLV